MDEEIRIAMLVYMNNAEACKLAAESGSLIAQHVQRVVAGMTDLMKELKPAGGLREAMKINLVAHNHCQCAAEHLQVECHNCGASLIWEESEGKWRHPKNSKVICQFQGRSFTIPDTIEVSE